MEAIKLASHKDISARRTRELGQSADDHEGPDQTTCQLHHQ
jgi:hypothetical protein